MFALLRLLVLQEEGGSEVDAGGSDGASATPEHYLWFRGIPNPPDDYQAPLGASPNTWPAIYGNLQNMDYCTATFAHLGNRIKCMKSFNAGPMLP